MPIIDPSPFEAAWWLPGPHLQTVCQQLLRRPPPVATTRETLPTPDGDFLHLDWAGPLEHGLVILLHGLTGSSRSIYIVGMQAALGRAGLGSVAVNFRGCSGEPNDTAHAYHSGETGDLDFVCRTLRRRYPGLPLAAVGYSLGGNMLLKWLGEQGRAAPLSGAAAVSAPLLLDRCASRMDRGLSRVYRNQLLKELKEYVAWKLAHLRAKGWTEEAARLEALGDLDAVRSFWEYDERVVAQLYGFRDARDYYGRSSARQYLKAIAIPTLIVHSRDDPFMTPEVIPDAAELSDSIHLEVTARGGHVGFVGGPHPGRPRYWLEERIPAFLLDRLASASVQPLRRTAR